MDDRQELPGGVLLQFGVVMPLQFLDCLHRGLVALATSSIQCARDGLVTTMAVGA